MIDRWREILQTLDRNRFRTVLTAASVAWGIFMLVVLLGAGRGLQNAVEWRFRDDAVNSVWVYRGKTSKPYQGHPVGRFIQFDNRDHELIRDTVSGVEHITSRFYLWGDYTVAYGDRRSVFSVRSCHPDHQYLENTEVKQGRFLDDLDLAEKRKVAVIGEEVAKFLFRGASALGEWIDIAGIRYRVVGVFTDSGGPGEVRQIYLPITTAQAAYGGGDDVHQLMFTVGDASADQAAAIGDRVKGLLASRHHFDVNDPQAVRVRNNLEEFEELQQVFRFIDLFVWLVGAGTLMAGIVGVSNIMLVSVKERTTEFGLRKALGATPASIVAMVLQEAVLLTAVAGYVGLVAGVGVLELARVLPPENDYVRDPGVNLGVAVGAMLLLTLFGALAGFFPAWRAATVSPIVALRDE